MKMLRLSLASCLLLACHEPTSDPCGTLGPVQLVESDSMIFAADRAGDHTFILFTPDWSDGVTNAVHVGEACGADAREIGRGIRMRPVHLHPGDPDADDASLVCDYSQEYFYRLDLEGARGPALVLPRFSCNRLLVTPHGPILAERDQRGLWHLPNFPDDTDAVEIDPSGDATAMRVIGDNLYYLTVEGIRRHDLTTGANGLLVPDAAILTSSETHLLWLARVASNTIPLHVHDLATGTNSYIGLYHAAEDNAAWNSIGPSWHLDADGAHILHVPSVVGSVMTAFDLTGEQVPFNTSPGTRLAFPERGGVLVMDGATLVHAVPGSATGTPLDLPAGARLDNLQLFPEHLEVLVARDLHAVPLDGGPSTLLARDIDLRRARIDEHTLLTLGDHRLTLVHHPSNQRKVLDRLVEGFQLQPGHGVYYSRLGAPEASINGVWWLSEDSLDAAFSSCGGACP